MTLSPKRKKEIKRQFELKHLGEAIAGIDEAITASLEMKPYPQEEIKLLESVLEKYNNKLKELLIND